MLPVSNQIENYRRSQTKSCIRSMQTIAEADTLVLQQYHRCRSTIAHANIEYAVWAVFVYIYLSVVFCVGEWRQDNERYTDNGSDQYPFSQINNNKNDILVGWQNGRVVGDDRNTYTTYTMHKLVFYRGMNNSIGSISW